MFPGWRKEESSHIQLGSSQQAQSHVLPSTSSSPACAVTPLVLGCGGACGFPRPRLCPTTAQRQAVRMPGGWQGTHTLGYSGAGGRADGACNGQ